MKQNDYIIETTNLTKQYQNVNRVDHVNLKVPSSCIYGFLGPNGAGKSTTLKMLLGLTPKTSGSISMFGMEWNAKNRLSILKNVGALIESPSFYGHLTARENLSILCSLQQVKKSRIDEVLSIVRHRKQENKRVSQFSLGMKQRLGIAMALLNEPKLLILDEPTNGLDPSGISEMRELLLSLPQQYGMTIVISSHLLSEIEQTANELGIISNGSLIYQDSLAHLHEQNSHVIAYRTDDLEFSLRCFENTKYSPKILDSYLLFSNLKEQEIPKINEYLHAHSITIYRIEEREKNLEQLFLELTGKAVSL